MFYGRISNSETNPLIGQEYLSDHEEEVTISVCLVFITQYGITSYVYWERNGKLVPVVLLTLFIFA